MIYSIQWYMCSELNPIQDHRVLQPFAQAGPRSLLGFDKIRTRRRRCIGGVFLAQRCKFLLLFGRKIREHGPEVVLGPCGTVAREVPLLSAVEACARNLSVALFLTAGLPGTCKGSGCRWRRRGGGDGGSRRWSLEGRSILWAECRAVGLWHGL